MRNKKYTIIGIAVALWICIVGLIGFRVYRSGQQYSDWIQQAAAYEQEGKYEEALILRWRKSMKIRGIMMMPLRF